MLARAMYEMTATNFLAKKLEFVMKMKKGHVVGVVAEVVEGNSAMMRTSKMEIKMSMLAQVVHLEMKTLMSNLQMMARLFVT
jgi:hypothetical protein